MQLLLMISLIFGLCLLASATAHPPYILHERGGGFGESQYRRRANGDTVRTFTIALEQRNLQHGEALLLNISDPGSPHYGRHWKSQQISEMFSPSEESVASVQEWLSSSNIQSSRSRRGTLSFEASIHQMEKLLQTEYYTYAGFDRESGPIGCEQYHLPEDVAQHIDYVFPAVAQSEEVATFHEIKEYRSRLAKRDNADETREAQHDLAYYISAGIGSLAAQAEELAECGKAITPACLRALYHIPSPREVAQDYHIYNNTYSSAIGVLEALNYYNQTDLDLYFAKYAPWVSKGTHPLLRSVENATVLQSSSERAESDVDFDIVHSLLYPQPIALYQVGPKLGYQTGSDSPAALNGALFTGMENLLDALDASYCDSEDIAHDLDCGIYRPAHVFSISYATGEIFMPARLQRKQCNEMMKLSLQGHTFISASGDYGVADELKYHDDGTWTNGCIDPKDHSGTVSSTVNGSVFSPSYPANCPYVLSVGATMLNDDDSVLDPEVAMHMPRAEMLKVAAAKGVTPQPYTTSSGGGFSNYFARPKYQAAVVDDFFASHDPSLPSYLMNDSDCTVQSASAAGGVYNRAGRGIPDVSANGAKFAAFVDGQETTQWGTSIAVPIWASLLTLVNQKRLASGKSPVGFVQPVLYRNPEIFHDITGGSNPGCGREGFHATDGWDPVTGLGTPHFQKLLEVFLDLP